MLLNNLPLDYETPLLTGAENWRNLHQAAMRTGGGGGGLHFEALSELERGRPAGAFRLLTYGRGPNQTGKLHRFLLEVSVPGRGKFSFWLD